VKLRERGNRHRPKRGTNLILIGDSLSGARRQLMRSDVDVSQAERAVLPADDERHAAQSVHDRHRVGEAVQRTAPENGVLVDERIGLVPVHLQPVGRDIERRGKP